jgi:hypothetical protein
MSRHATKPRRRPAKGHPPARPVSDLGPYIGFGIIWLFASTIIYLTAPGVGPLFATAALAGFFAYVTVCCARAHRGATLFRWQKGLVRLPLILTGSARTPVAAIAGERAGRNATIAAGVITLVLIVATAIVALPALDV